MVLSCCTRPSMHDCSLEYDLIPCTKAARSRTRLSLELVDDRFSASRLNEPPFQTLQPSNVVAANSAELGTNHENLHDGADFYVAKPTTKELMKLKSTHSQPLTVYQYTKLCTIGTTIVMGATLPDALQNGKFGRRSLNVQTTTPSRPHHVYTKSIESSENLAKDWRAEEVTGDNFSSLPTELLIAVLENLPLQTLCNCMLVSLRLSRLALATAFSKTYINAFNHAHIIQFNQFLRHSYRFNQPRSLCATTNMYDGRDEAETSIKALHETIASFDVSMIMKDRDFIRWNDTESNSFSITFATQNEDCDWQSYAVAARINESSARIVRIDYRQVWTAHLRCRKTGVSGFKAVLRDASRTKGHSRKMYTMVPMTFKALEHHAELL